MKIQNMTGRFLAQLHPSNFFVASFAYCLNFSIHEFLSSEVVRKLFEIRFPYKPVNLPGARPLMNPLRILMLKVKARARHAFTLKQKNLF